MRGETAYLSILSFAIFFNFTVQNLEPKSPKNPCGAWKPKVDDLSREQSLTYFLYCAILILVARASGGFKSTHSRH